MSVLAPYLIEGLLEQGHKMLITGPSKAGKVLGGQSTNYLLFVIQFIV